MKSEVCVRCNERPKWHPPDNKYRYSYCLPCHKIIGKQGTTSEDGNYFGSDEHLHKLADRYRPKEQRA